jgi:hypothetical protein
VKKLPILFFLFFASLALWAVDDDPPPAGTEQPPEQPPAGQEQPPEQPPAGTEDDAPETETEAVADEEDETPPPPPPKRKGYRMKNRAFEIGVANLQAGFANDFIATDDFIWKTAIFKLFQDGNIFRDDVEIDVNKFLDGFRFDFGLDIRPFFFNINVKDRWGFGLDVARIETAGNVGISGNLLGLKQVRNDDSTGAGAAVFVDVGIPIFFHIKKFKINFRPAVFVPLAYVPPGGITYSYERSVTDKDGISITGVKISAKYNLGIYTPIPINEFIDGSADPDPLAMVWSLLDNWKGFGYDFNLGAEYPYDEQLDLGLNLTGIPFIPANLGYGMGLSGETWADTSKIDIYELLKEDADIEKLLKDAYGYPENFDLKPIAGGLKVMRPFKLVAYADWRPFETPWLALIPALGFAINPLYVKPASFEGGLSIRLDLGNIFVATFGINYMDRKWKNSIDCTLLNLRALQIDLGLVFQSQDFVESWRGAGLALNFGVKLGW